MTTTSEILSGQTREGDTLSRLSRNYHVGERRNHDRNFRVPHTHRFYILLLSLIVSLLSVALPLFSQYANAMQSQNLYTGLMMAKGQLPYSDVFATGSFFYYLLIMLSYLLGSSIWLVPAQMLFFYMAGIYLYKIIYYLTDKRQVTLGFATIFYGLNIVLGFGGLYPSQFGMPFILLAIWFLLRYFAGIIEDEVFVIYGFVGAFALLFDPQSLVFWVLSFMTIAIYNIRHRHLARGFYQLLCIIFGTLLIIYTAGFFIFNLQILSSYIEQAFVYPFVNPAMGADNLWLALLLQLLVALGSGLLYGLFGIFQKKDYQVTALLLTLATVIYLVLALFSSDYSLYHLLPLTVYGLILAAGEFRERRGRRAKETGASAVISSYVKQAFYVPALLVLLAIGHFGYRVVTMAGSNQERSAIANYITKDSKSNDAIYVWDQVATIYSSSQRRAGSSFVLPNVNTHKASNRQALIDNLLESDTPYIVVKKTMKVPSDVKKMLKKDYKTVSISATPSFTLYQKK